jgi:hypothetical protein
MKETIENKRKSGRPVGSRGKAKVPALLDRLMVANRCELKQIIESVIKLAEGGEQWAIEAVADRVWPKPQGRTVTFDLPDIRTAADGEAAIGAILSACGAGRLTPAESKTLADIVHRKVEVAHMREVSDRLARLEQSQAPQQISSYRKVA